MYYQVNLSKKIAHRQCFFLTDTGYFMIQLYRTQINCPRRDCIHTLPPDHEVRCRRQSWVTANTPLQNLFFGADSPNDITRHDHIHTSISRHCRRLGTASIAWQTTACICFWRRITYVNNYFGLFDGSSQNQLNHLQEFYMMKQSRT
jgi:hypothetical protein